MTDQEDVNDIHASSNRRIRINNKIQLHPSSDESSSGSEAIEDNRKIESDSRFRGTNYAKLHRRIKIMEKRLFQITVQLRLVDRPENYHGPMIVRTPWRIPRGRFDPNFSNKRKRKWSYDTSNSEEEDPKNDRKLSKKRKFKASRF